MTQFRGKYLYLSLLAGQVFAFLNGITPRTYGIVLFRAFDAIDIYAPFEVLYFIGQMHETQVALISDSMEPVTSEPLMTSMNPFNSSVFPVITPTHTFETAPEMDVLIIPGGPGMRSPEMNNTLKYIRETAPKVKHVITICTGSGLAARAGILDGKRATTNKSSWPRIIPFGPKTNWVPRARWVEEENSSPPIWSSSGGTAGFDLMFHFVETFYSKENATFISNLIEYVRQTDPNDDPFSRNETVLTSSVH